MIYTSSNIFICNAVTCLNGKYTILFMVNIKKVNFGNKTDLIGIVLKDTFKVQIMLGICDTRVQFMVNGIGCGQMMLYSIG